MECVSWSSNYTTQTHFSASHINVKMKFCATLYINMLINMLMIARQTEPTVYIDYLILFIRKTNVPLVSNVQ